MTKILTSTPLLTGALALMFCWAASTAAQSATAGCGPDDPMCRLESASMQVVDSGGQRLGQRMRASTEGEVRRGVEARRHLACTPGTEASAGVLSTEGWPEVPVE